LVWDGPVTGLCSAALPRPLGKRSTPVDGRLLLPWCVVSARRRAKFALPKSDSRSWLSLFCIMTAPQATSTQPLAAGGLEGALVQPTCLVSTRLCLNKRIPESERRERAQTRTVLTTVLDSWRRTGSRTAHTARQGTELRATVMRHAAVLGLLVLLPLLQPAAAAAAAALSFDITRQRHRMHAPHRRRVRRVRRGGRRARGGAAGHVRDGRSGAAQRLLPAAARRRRAAGQHRPARVRRRLGLLVRRGRRERLEHGGYRAVVCHTRRGRRRRRDPRCAGELLGG